MTKQKIDLEPDIAAELNKHARPGEDLGSVITRLVQHHQRVFLREGIAHPEASYGSGNGFGKAEKKDGE